MKHLLKGNLKKYYILFEIFIITLLLFLFYKGFINYTGEKYLYTFLIPILYYFGNITALSFTFFVASLIALAIYSIDDKYKILDINKYR